MRSMMRGLRACAVGLGFALLASSPGCSSATPATTPSAPATFSAIYPLLFPTSTNPRCTFCHGLPANDRSNGNLGVGADKATAYAAIVGKTSTSSACGSRAIVVPGNPDQSLFYLKLSENPVCGSRMPLGGDLLTDAEREMVRSWIANGAKDD